MTVPDAQGADVRPEVPDAAARIFAFARALGLTFAQLLALLESYDLCLLDGKAGPRYPGVLRQIDGDPRFLPGGEEGDCRGLAN